MKSGQDVLKTFYKAREKYPITIKRRGKGSHVVLHNGECSTFSVPLHKELKSGTLLGIITNSGMTKEDFLEYDP